MGKVIAEYIEKKSKEPITDATFPASYITPQEVLASYKKYDGKVLKFTLSKNIRKAASRAFDVYYFDLLFKKMDGSTSKIQLQLSSQLLGSGLKHNTFSEDPMKGNTHFISIRAFSKAEIRQNSLIPDSDYIVNALYENCLMNVAAVKIITDEYKRLVSSLKQNGRRITYVDETGKEYNFKCPSAMKLCSLEQSKFTNKEGMYEQMDFSLFRFKIKSDAKTGLFQRKAGKDSTTPMIFNLASKNRAGEVMAAKVRDPVSKKKEDISKYNGDRFITYGSLATIQLTLGTAVLSSQGWSLGSNITEMVIKSRKPRRSTPTFEPKIISAMEAFSPITANDNSDDEDEVDDDDCFDEPHEHHRDDVSTSDDSKDTTTSVFSDFN